jgi:DNA polymerase-3 subunit alpha
MSRVTPEYMNRRQFEVLVKAGAFDNLGENRATLLNNADLLLGYMQSLHQEKDSNQVNLFGGDSEEELPKPALRRETNPDPLEILEHEQAAIGFYLSSHPMQSYKTELEQIPGLYEIATLGEQVQQGIDRGKIAGIIVARRQMKTKTGKKMAFVSVSDATGQVEVAFFPEGFTQFYDKLEGQGPYIFTIRMEQNGDLLRASVDHVMGMDDSLKHRPKLDLKLKNPERLKDLAALLNVQSDGTTACTLEYHREHERVVFDLGRRIALTRPLMNRLQGLSGLELQ